MTRGDSAPPKGGRRRKEDLLCAYAAGVLSIREDDDLDATANKMLLRLKEIDALTRALQDERSRITAALLSVAYHAVPDPSPTKGPEETDYLLGKPFRRMSLTDACLRVLREHRDEWLDKNQVEYMLVAGGYEFKTKRATNSVHVTLRRLVQDGYCESYDGKGSRAAKLRFVKDKDPTDLTAKTRYKPGEGPYSSGEFSAA